MSKVKIKGINTSGDEEIFEVFINEDWVVFSEFTAIHEDDFRKILKLLESSKKKGQRE